MLDERVDERDLAVQRSNWVPDEWDEVGEVPAVEPMRRQSRIVKWVVWIALAVVASLVIVAGYVGWWYLDRVRPEGELTEPVAFTVQESDTLPSLASRLERQGFVDDADVFQWYIDQKGGLELVPGFYQIRKGDHMGNVLARLQTPPDQTYQRVTFPEGFTIEQMADRLAEEIPRLDRDAFVEAATDGSIRSRFSPPGRRSLEGLLFPDTYQISNADNEAQVVERMAALMERVAGDQEDLEADAERVQRTPYDILIIASMIEKEAKLDEDRPKIAAVIYNRLFLGMNLQIDAAVRYGAPDPGMPFAQMRQIPGPYNTYLNPGLPATPISNPGRASIEAALNPAPPPPPGDPICQELEDPTTNCLYLYYVLADENGRHAFAATGEQHQANVERAAARGLLD
jgi:UPF0755 protein